MKRSEELTYAEIALLLRADFDTGKLFWLPRTPDVFTVGKHSAELRCAMWNSRYAGKEAFTLNDEGYRTGRIFDRTHSAHRVIWLLHTGEWPTDQIDHINGDRADNRICNLRAASNVDNGRNQQLRSTNTSGVQGVCWHKRDRKWVAQIRVDGRRKNLGAFPDIASAIAARKAAEIEYGFHTNHGRT